MIKKTVLIGWCMVFVLVVQTAFSFPNYVNLIPNGSQLSCAACHSPVPSLNSFGAAFAANGNTWNRTLAVLDSDEDTFTNGQELGDPNGTGTATPGAEVTNPGDPASRPSITLPVITTQPSSQTVAAGGNATFTVVAAGPAPFSYQWRKDGVDIPGATDSSLVLTSVTATDAGNYTVVVTGSGGGTVTSNTALLTVTPSNVGPQITAQPASQTLLVGSNVTFTVSATGIAPLTYQWRKNSIDIPGATDSSFTLNNVQTADAGTYSVVVSDATGAVTSSDAVLTVLSEGPVSFLKGSYNGLFFDPDGVAPESAGAFNLNTTTEGAFSGRLQLGRSRYSLSGQFDQTGNARETIERRGKAPLEVVLQLDPTDTDRMTGTVSDGTFTADLLGNRAVFSRQNPAPQAGRYTLVFAGSSGGADTPGGDGFGTVKVSQTGKIQLAGSLADGTKISQTSQVSKDGDWPLFIPLYSGGGLLQGWLTFADAPNDLSGEVVWIKPELRRADMYPGGFEVTTTATGSRFESPRQGNSILDFTNGVVILSGGGIGEIVNEITLGDRGRVINQSPNRLTLKISPSTGAFTGRVTHPTTGIIFPFSGVVVQSENIGTGWFRGNRQSGKVTLQELVDDAP